MTWTKILTFLRWFSIFFSCQNLLQSSGFLQDVKMTQRITVWKHVLYCFIKCFLVLLTCLWTCSCDIVFVYFDKCAFCSLIFSCPFVCFYKLHSSRADIVHWQTTICSGIHSLGDFYTFHIHVFGQLGWGMRMTWRLHPLSFESMYSIF